MEPLNILFINEKMKLVILWHIQKGEDSGVVYFYENGLVGDSRYPQNQMARSKFSYGEHEQLAKEGLTRWDM